MSELILPKHFKDSAEEKFNTELGQKASVERTQTKSELAEISNKRLREMGEKLNPSVGELKLTYLGSAAVHIYKSEVLQHMYFVSQTAPLQDCPELIASAAFQNLKGDLLEFYNRRRQTKRSGF